MKGLCVRGSWRPNRTATPWLPLSWPSAFLSRSPVLLNLRPGAQLSAGCCFLYSIISPTRLIQKNSRSGAWGLLPLGSGFLYRNLSPTGLVSKLTDFLPSLSYIIVQRPLLLVGVTIALIPPIHGQGYKSDIPWPNAPIIYIGAFPIFTAWPGRRSIYNILFKNF